MKGALGLLAIAALVWIFWMTWEWLRNRDKISPFDKTSSEKKVEQKEKDGDS